MTWKEAEKIAREMLGVGDDYIMYSYKVRESRETVVVMLDKMKDGKWAYEDIKCEIPLPKSRDDNNANQNPRME